jgi:hypothetical protein
MQFNFPVFSRHCYENALSGPSRPANCSFDRDHPMYTRTLQEPFEFSSFDTRWSGVYAVQTQRTSTSSSTESRLPACILPHHGYLLVQHMLHCGYILSLGFKEDLSGQSTQSVTEGLHIKPNPYPFVNDSDRRHQIRRRRWPLNRGCFVQNCSVHWVEEPTKTKTGLLWHNSVAKVVSRR